MDGMLIVNKYESNKVLITSDLLAHVSGLGALLIRWRDGKRD